ECSTSPDISGSPCKQRAGPRVPQGAQQGLGAMPNMLPDDAVKCILTRFAIGVCQSTQFCHQVRMGTNGSLPEDDKVARNDIGALYRNSNRQGAIQAAQRIGRAIDNGF